MEELVYKYWFSKEHFIQDCYRLKNNNTNGYLIDIKDDNNIWFGIEKRGHCGGNWYVATINEKDNELTITGKIVLNHDENGQTIKTSKIPSVIKIFIVFVYILFW